ncbi:MAG TPA: hypothetical protein VJV40_01480 [Thermodesulfobacteriota bacterium]|nr:hypothetical protein [Thermodesulfobacteriota bacterium]
MDSSFGLNAGQSCYNYTFIDNKSIRGTLLEKEEMDSSPDKPDSVSYDAVRNLCRPNNARQLAALEKTNALGGGSEDTEGLSDNPILPNPDVKFIEDGKLSYEQLQSKQTIFYGGIVPFVAVHDADLETDDHFFNPDSVSLFLYFKRKF